MEIIIEGFVISAKCKHDSKVPRYSSFAGTKMYSYIAFRYKLRILRGCLLKQKRVRRRVIFRKIICSHSSLIGQRRRSTFRSALQISKQNGTARSSWRSSHSPSTTTLQVQSPMITEYSLISVILLKMGQSGLFLFIFVHFLDTMSILEHTI